MLQMINWSALAELFTYDPARPLLFNSAAFFLLFLLFYGVYLLSLRGFNWRILYTLGFSYFFYYKSSGFFFVLLLISTVVDFIMGHFIYHAADRGRRRFYLWVSLAVNLGILGYFKYTNFFIGIFNSFTGGSLGFADIFLPVGISFFTFQTMSYSIDIYRGSLVPVTESIHDGRSFLTAFMDFAFFVSFFPQLVAGPIVRAAEFLPQIRQRPQLDEARLSEAFLLIISGLFKKAVISDYISINFVDRIFESPSLYSGLENLMAIYGYALQIYCDFSGYSDMAIGLALLLGFRLPENFRTPYQSASVQEFWRRWHISLSTWLRDYLYISLGGNRRGRLRTYVNLMITMLLGGLWHGASWVFVLWGGLHGLGLAVDRYLQEKASIFKNPALRSFTILALVQLLGAAVLWAFYLNQQLPPEEFHLMLGNNFLLLGAAALLVGIARLIDIPLRQVSGQPFRASKVVSILFVFHFVCFCWIFFRTGALNAPLPPLTATGQILTQLLSVFRPELFGQLITGYPAVISLIALGFVLHFLPESWYRSGQQTYERLPLVAKAFSLALVIWLVVQTASSEVVPFIYFQF